MAHAKKKIRKVNKETMVVKGYQWFCLVPMQTAIPKMAWQIMEVQKTGQDNSALGDIAGLPDA